MESLEALRLELKSELLSLLSKSSFTDRELLDQIDGALLPLEKLTLRDKLWLRNRLFNSLRKLDILSEPLEDPSVTEIMINGYREIFIERNGEYERWDQCFESPEQLEELIQQIVSRIDRSVNTLHPIADARLPDGSRVHIVLPPISLRGAIVNIRKFPEPITMEKLIRFRSITEEAADFLKQLVISAYSIFISGGTSSGKTTFLNALSQFIPERERVITIEDSAELQLKHIPNLVSLETRNKNSEGEGEVTIAELIRSSLRMSPNRIIVGEVRGAECLDMLNAMNTGHDGSLSTGHGNSGRDMLRRMETMVLQGAELPLPAIRNMIASAIQILVHLGRGGDQKRRVLEISEILGVENGEIKTKKLFEYDGKTLRRIAELTDQKRLRERLPAL